MPESLAQLQQVFADALLDPRRQPDLFRSDPADPRTANRLALYRGNLTAHWTRALADAFPVVQALLGEEFFQAMAKSYGRWLGYGHGDLNRLGERLPDFLADFEPLADYPYMADVGRLEWALHLAHYGPDTPALTPAALASVPPDRVADLCPGLHPNVRLLASQWAIGNIWFAHQPGTAGTLPSSPVDPSRLAVCRPRWRAEVRPLAEGEYAALDAIGTGSALGEALERGFDADPAFDPGTAVPRWLEDGFLATPDSLTGAHP